MIAQRSHLIGTFLRTICLPYQTDRHSAYKCYCSPPLLCAISCRKAITVHRYGYFSVSLSLLAAGVECCLPSLARSVARPLHLMAEVGRWRRSSSRLRHSFMGIVRRLAAQQQECKTLWTPKIASLQSAASRRVHFLTQTD